jgi:hypothetical protein
MNTIALCAPFSGWQLNCLRTSSIPREYISIALWKRLRPRGDPGAKVK